MAGGLHLGGDVPRKSAALIRVAVSPIVGDLRGVTVFVFSTIAFAKVPCVRAPLARQGLPHGNTGNCFRLWLGKERLHRGGRREPEAFVPAAWLRMDALPKAIPGPQNGDRRAGKMVFRGDGLAVPARRRSGPRT